MGVSAGVPLRVRDTDEAVFGSDLIARMFDEEVEPIWR
jgi:hypothetical protein